MVALRCERRPWRRDGTLITPELRLGYDREALSGSRTLTVATVSVVPTGNTTDHTVQAGMRLRF